MAVRLDPVTLIGGPHDGTVTSHTLRMVKTKKGEYLIENISGPLGPRGERLGAYYYNGDGTATWRSYAAR